MKSFLPLLVVFFLICGVENLYSQSISLSDKAEISLLIASPGDELYSIFGHSAIRVYDPDNSIDLVFNYGTFDFNTPYFYFQFVRGKLLYKLSVSSMEYFIAEYRFDGRAVFEQVLNLDFNEKQQMFEFLLWNQQPENAYYHYDFFYDNCATRIRDLADALIAPHWHNNPEIIKEQLPSISLLFNYEFDYKPDVRKDRTLRDLLQSYLMTMPWSKFGIDLALGLPADRIATSETSMFLPDEMLIAFALAQKPDGLPLVAESRIVLPKTLELTPAGFFKPWMATSIVLLLSLACFINKKWGKIFDLSFFTILGITGVVIIFLWAFTDHNTTKSNLNILWALPTHLYFIWSVQSNKSTTIQKAYFALNAILGLLLLIFWSLIPQDFNIAFLPLLFISILRSVAWSNIILPSEIFHVSNKGPGIEHKT